VRVGVIPSGFRQANVGLSSRTLPIRDNHWRIVLPLTALLAHNAKRPNLSIRAFGKFAVTYACAGFFVLEIRCPVLGMDLTFLLGPFEVCSLCCGTVYSIFPR
jgi:hypothetical protein